MKMDMLIPGEAVPHFKGATPSNPTYSFGTAAGRYIVLAVLPDDNAWVSYRLLLQSLEVHRSIFDDTVASFFGITRHAELVEQVVDQVPGIRWFLDREGAITRALGCLDDEGREVPACLVLDPMLRVMKITPFGDIENTLAWLKTLPPVDDHALTPLVAPILIVPRVFEPRFCETLIAFYHDAGGKRSGFMQEADGQTVLVSNPNHKRRSDAIIEDQDLQREIRMRLSRRLLPEVTRAFQFTATRIERFIVACYDSADQGFFRPHRDNTTKGTAHRKFAVTLNLNTGDYAGGDLRFPEFGSHVYRAPLGGAVVFSCALLHEATPVTRGTRYAFLPFLYDDEGARLREANAKFLSRGSNYKADAG